MLSIAERVYASGDLSSAISFYRRAIAVDPTLVQAYLGLGEALLAAGYPNDANAAFAAAQSRAASEAPSPERTVHEVAAMRGQGLTLITLNQPAGAVEILDKANAVAPAAPTYSALGVAEDVLGDTDAADKAYKQGLALAPDDLDLQNNYGLSQALHGDLDGAVATLRRVASDAKASARHRLNLALVLGLAGRTDDAAQVARIDLDERSVRSNLAYYAELRGLPEKARAAAILRPSKPLEADAVAGSCATQPCPKPVPPDEKLSAIPTTPVSAKPLPLSPPATPKPASETVDPAEQNASQPSPSDTSMTKSQSTEPAPMAEDTKAATPAQIEPALASPPATDQPDAKPLLAQDGAKPTVVAPTVVAKDEPTPLSTNEPARTVQDETKPSQSDAEPSPAATIDNTTPPEKTEAEKAAADKTAMADATPAATDSDPEPSERPASHPAAPASPVVKAAVVLPPPTGKHAWLQIASFRSEQNALSARKKMTKENDDLLRQVSLSVRRVDLGSPKGVYYVLLVGPLASRNEARDFCAALKDRKIACVVAR